MDGCPKCFGTGRNYIGDPCDCGRSRGSATAAQLERQRGDRLDDGANADLPLAPAGPPDALLEATDRPED